MAENFLVNEIRRDASFVHLSKVQDRLLQVAKFALGHSFDGLMGIEKPSPVARRALGSGAIR
jgi:hypothetical protein